MNSTEAHKEDSVNSNEVYAMVKEISEGIQRYRAMFGSYTKPVEEVEASGRQLPTNDELHNTRAAIAASTAPIDLS